MMTMVMGARPPLVLRAPVVMRSVVAMPTMIVRTAILLIRLVARTVTRSATGMPPQHPAGGTADPGTNQLAIIAPYLLTDGGTAKSADGPP